MSARKRSTESACYLESLTVPAGETATFFVLYSGGGADGEPAPRRSNRPWRAASTPWRIGRRRRLPYGRVQVPDAGIQALVDSSIRNIWQAREIKKGLPAFQVGPTCYRGLWIVDGAFLLEAAAMLGAGNQARNGVAYELTYQKPDGRIEVMQNYLEGKRHRALDVRPPRAADAGQSLARSAMAQARAHRRVHQAACASKR